MKKQNINMTKFGIGPRFFLSSIIYTIIIIFININYFHVKIPISKMALLLLGIVLIIFGGLLYVFSVRRVMKAFNERRLECFLKMLKKKYKPEL